MAELYASLCVIGFALFGYLMGSIPNAVIIGKIHHSDITKFGSGNPGGTNVWRAFGWKAGLSCMILDFMKGFIPAFVTLLITAFVPAFHNGTISSMNFLGYSHWNIYTIASGALAMIGHAFPIFFHFKGGKNVMVTCGVIGATCPLMMGIAISMFVLFELTSKKISVGSIAAALTVFIYSYTCVAISFVFLYFGKGGDYLIGGWYFGKDLYFVTDWLYGIVLLSDALFVVFRHKSNINKLVHGEEKDFDPSSHELEQDNK